MLEVELPELDFVGFDFDFDGLFEEEREEKPRSEIALTESISVVVECEDDEQAEQLFMKLSEEGYTCRISTL